MLGGDEVGGGDSRGTSTNPLGRLFWAGGLPGGSARGPDLADDGLSCLGPVLPFSLVPSGKTAALHCLIEALAV